MTDEELLKTIRMTHSNPCVMCKHQAPDDEPGWNSRPGDRCHLHYHRDMANCIDINYKDFEMKTND
jgi:hypothetical protein